ncbi:MAG: O-antigen ligase family protein [Planctomycetes bacterium]|nr:O-antigen ligase family protein [Planctomycetota bacterium]
MRFFEPARIKPSTVSGWVLKLIAVALVIATPWWYGSVTWQSQHILASVGIALAGLLAIHSIFALAEGERGWKPNWLTWLFLGLAAFSLLQAHPRYTWSGTKSSAPPSIQMQRWAMGLQSAPSGIQSDNMAGDSVESNSGTSASLTCELQNVPDAQRFFSLSVDPVTTRAAAGSLFLCAILSWIGGAVFRQRESYPLLLGAVVAVGAMVAAYGLYGAVRPKAENFLGLKYGGSYSVFVSKNSAGAYLNLVIAAGLGVCLWTANRAKDRAARSSSHRHEEFPWRIQLKRSIAEFLARLDAFQIAAFLALLLLAVSLLVSLCRGAAVSGATGLITTLGLVATQLYRTSGVDAIGRKRRSTAGASAVCIGIIAIAACVGVMVGLRLDDRVFDRLESIGEVGLESESSTGRLYIWGVSWTAARFYGLLGSGLGTFHYASLPFQDPTSTGWYYHAESLYAEILVTMGYVALLCVAGGIAWSLRAVWKTYVSERFRDFAPLQLAGSYLIISQSLHSVVDFALILPGVFIPAVLILGAVVRAPWESNRVVSKLKSKGSPSRKVSGAETQTGLRRSVIAISSVSLSVACMVALNYCRQSIHSLDIADRISREFDEDDKKEIDQRIANRVEHLVDRMVELGGKIEDSALGLRLLGDSIVADVRRVVWDLRPADVDPSAYWLQTSPLVLRLAKDRVSDDQRAGFLASIGGLRTISTLDRASYWYTIGQSLSPLDSRLIWGRISTAIDCPIADLVRMTHVLHRTAGHQPQMLTSVSILMSTTLSRDQLIPLWKTVIKTSPAAAIGVGRLIATLYDDASVPVELFPVQPQVLRNLAAQVFDKNSFPTTHSLILEKGLAVGKAMRMPIAKKSLWLADTAREAGNALVEIENLRICIQFYPKDTSLQVRLTERLIEQGDKDGAKDSLRQLMRSLPNDPIVKQLSERVALMQ